MCRKSSKKTEDVIETAKNKLQKLILNKSKEVVDRGRKTLKSSRDARSRMVNGTTERLERV
jgi:hypothetical protein